MKAAHVTRQPDHLTVALDDIPKPLPAPGEILVKVVAAAVTPTELLWYPTTHTPDGSPRRNAIPGHEFSGIIEAIGPGVHGFLPGDEVYGMNDWFADGATAEFCVAPASSIAPKPRKLSHLEAATVPISALTAWQGLFARAHLNAGERLLVLGGAGAVGAFVIQLAKLHGAEVIATASAANLDFLRSLKADEVVDHGPSPAPAVNTSMAKVDVLFDTVGGETLARAWPFLTPNGRAVTIAAESEGSREERAQKAFFIVEPSQEQLMNVAVLIDGGTLRPFVGAAVPLAEAPAAYAGSIPRKGPGKVVLVMPDFEE